MIRASSPRHARHARPAALAAAAAIGAAFPTLPARPIGLVRGVAISGCAATVSPDVCELPLGTARKLVIWIPWGTAREERVRVSSTDSATSTVTGSSATALAYHADHLPSGLRISVPFRLETPEATLELDVADEPVLTLALRAAPSFPWQKQVERASSRETLAQLGFRLQRATGAERSKLARAVAESEMALGNSARAFELLREGARVALERGRYSEARSHWLRAAYHHAIAHELQAAEEALGNARRVPQLSVAIDADGEAAAAYVSGMYASGLRDLPAAQRAYESGVVWVERGAELMAPQIAAGRAHIAEQQGRLSDAIRLLEDAQSTELSHVSPCFRALVTASKGWYELHAYSGEVLRIRSARRELERAVLLYASECTKAPPEEAASAHAYLGFAALALGDLAAARTALESTAGLQRSPRLSLWGALLEAELLFAEVHLEAAEAAFRRLEVDAQRLLSWDLAWHAREGTARVLLARNRPEDAVRHFERAEALLAESIQWIPVDSGVSQFLNAHARTAEGLAKTLLELGRVPEALDALRRARRRALASLSRRAGSPPASAAWREAMGTYLTARDRVERIATELETCPSPEQAFLQKQLSAEKESARKATDALVRLRRDDSAAGLDALRRPGPDEALLLWTELARTWHGFLASDGKVHHVSVDTKPQDLGWLQPFEPWLVRTRKLSVLAEGPFASVDIHALTLEGLPKLEVAYALDLPSRPRSAERLDHDVIAGDAFGDLPRARQEVESIYELLTSAGEHAKSLVGAASSAAELRDAMLGARRLHYAGHAEFLGIEGWQSQLVMARSEVTAGDILSLPRVPDEVILSACEAAREPGLLHTAGLGLAQAFLLAGARAVVAPSRPVSEVAARQFSLELWRRLARGTSLEAAYHATLTGVPAGDDARAFRLLLLE